MLKLRTAIVSAAVVAGALVAPVTPALSAPGGVAVSVKRATAYGKSMTVTVKAANRPRTKMTIRVVAGGTASSKVVTTNAAGVASWSLAARGSGRVTVNAPGTRTLRAGAGSATFVTAGAATATLTGHTRVVKGVAHYRSLDAVHADLQILPRHAGQVTVSLQHLSGSSWVTDQNATFATNKTGGAWVGLVSGNRTMTYRYVVNAAADATAAASPKVTTTPFMVG
ncbi:hypothetical protein [Paractinoplanes brasiliensis]|uniref:Uncharacterized protein n=1 Tax=Paractinoplanes brasiliensis TaxID=52695 RepID=A0A4R6J9G3_9ACTN|nr:hypothetical protein [Actinoplanes brasiliensis]TDO32274.1 hypothetical protein C8E87_7730 [Actinoplanes brasiliensis]